MHTCMKPFHDNVYYVKITNTKKHNNKDVY
jgi:hypothetical protein